MNIPAILATVASLALVLRPALAETPPADQRASLREAAAKLCTELRGEKIEGLPTAAQMKRLAPLMTPELRYVIGKARSQQQRQMREAPDEKPDWIEGDLFSSSFEGVTSWEIGDTFIAPGVDATVKVKQTCAEPGQKPVRWIDTLVFKPSGERWLLDDIRMGGEWEFKTGASLRDILPGGGREEQDHESPDGRWRVAFTRDGDDVKRVTIEPKDGSAKPEVLFGGDGDDRCPMPTWVVWSPEGDMFALRLGDSPRFTRTVVFRREGKHWRRIELPVFYPGERKTMETNGFIERDNLVDAEHWRDADTLVVRFFCSYVKEDEGDGYHKFVSVRIDPKGKARVVGAVDVPGDG